MLGPYTSLVHGHAPLKCGHAYALPFRHHAQYRVHRPITSACMHVTLVGMRPVCLLEAHACRDLNSNVLHAC